MFKTGNFNLIPILSCIVGLLCSSCWLVFGIYTEDINVIIPNALGIVFSIFQITCWVIYYRRAKSDPRFQHFLITADDAAITPTKGDQEKCYD